MLLRACLHSCLSNQCCLDPMQMGKCWQGEQGQQRAKILLGSQWDGGEKQDCGKWRTDTALGIWDFTGEESHPSLLQGMQPALASPARSGFLPLNKPDATWQPGEQVIPPARKTSWIEWKTLPRWAAAADGVQPACG